MPVAQRREGDAELALAVAERPELVCDPLRPFLVHLKRLEAMAEVRKFDRHSQQQRHPHMRLRLEGRGPLRTREKVSRTSRGLLENLSRNPRGSNGSLFAAS